MKPYKIIIYLVCLLQTTLLYAWNALGHRVIAKVAYDNMTSRSKKMCNHYNQILNKHHKRLSFVNAAPWLDTLYDKNLQPIKAMHYIDIPFSVDNTKLPPIPLINAVVAIQLSTRTLQDPKATPIDKAIAFRILLHVVGDIHQPLHAITKVSNNRPMGDRGGNLVLLRHNKVASNLHAYWDNGGGFLSMKSPHQKDVTLLATQIEKQWPCEQFATAFDPLSWASDSHHLALTYAYRLKNFMPLSDGYQYKTQRISQEQLAKAGCRLASIYNIIAENLERGIATAVPLKVVFANEVKQSRTI